MLKVLKLGEYSGLSSESCDTFSDRLPQREEQWQQWPFICEKAVQIFSLFFKWKLHFGAETTDIFDIFLPAAAEKEGNFDVPLHNAYKSQGHKL